MIDGGHGSHNHGNGARARSHRQARWTRGLCDALRASRVLYRWPSSSCTSGCRGNRMSSGLVTSVEQYRPVARNRSIAAMCAVALLSALVAFLSACVSTRLVCADCGRGCSDGCWHVVSAHRGCCIHLGLDDHLRAVRFRLLPADHAHGALLREPLDVHSSVGRLGQPTRNPARSGDSGVARADNRPSRPSTPESHLRCGRGVRGVPRGMDGIRHVVRWHGDLGVLGAARDWRTSAYSRCSCLR